MGSVSTKIATDSKPDRVPSALVMGSGLGAMITCAELLALRFNVCMLELPDLNLDDLYYSGPGLDLVVFVESLKSVRDQVEIYPSEGWPQIYRDEVGFLVDTDTLRNKRFDTLFLAGVLEPRLPGASFQDPCELYKPSLLCQALPQDLVFMLDHFGASDPAAAMSAIVSAISNIRLGGTSSIIFENAPVCHLYGETLYDTAKNSGVTFYRPEEKSLEISRREIPETVSTKITVRFKDRIERGAELEILCDRLLLVAGTDNNGIPESVRRFLGTDVDRDGFLISDSIHNNTYRSFNRGVYCIGGFSGTTDLLRVISQAKASAADARTFALPGDSKAQKSTITISNECVRCLTCHRICPHSAIWPSAAPSRSQMKSISSSCLECGICVSECPRMALDLVHFPEAAFSGFIEDIKNDPNKIVVYGCSRSAGRAVSKLNLPADVIFFSVPCAGRISESVILETIGAGIRGMLIVGCHHGNCASNNGTDWASDRVKSTVTDFLAPMGITTAVEYETMAPNEEKKLERIVNEFADRFRTR